MNKQLIEALVEQSTKVLPADWNCVEDLEVFDREKFAELIVKECIDLVNLWSNDEPCSEGYDTLPVLKIKQRFGIE